jgi:hypothetical protein
MFKYQSSEKKGFRGTWSCRRGTVTGKSAGLEAPFVYTGGAVWVGKNEDRKRILLHVPTASPAVMTGMQPQTLDGEKPERRCKLGTDH